MNKKRSSETAKIKNKIQPYLIAKDGLDIGYGGDPIINTAICIDLPVPYTKFGEHPQHLHGDGTKLYWFKDKTLDYIYSSHLLEDFEDPKPVIKEWLRVIKIGGLLILFLPNENKYRKHCDRVGATYNGQHKNLDMSLNWMLDFFGKNFEYRLNLVEADELKNDYCFYMIMRRYR